MKPKISLSINKLTELMRPYANEEKSVVLNGTVFMLISYGFTRVQATMLAVAAYNDLKVEPKPIQQ